MPTDQNRNFCVYCLEEDINDATFHYLEVIRQSIRTAGFLDLGVTQDKFTLRRCELVVTISCLPALRALTLNPRAKLLHWFQGIEAVERRFLHPGWRGYGRYILWSTMESILLRRANVKLFVSQEMREFMNDKDIAGSRSVIMPCYNVKFDDEAWNLQPNRYRKLDLVYAGSLYPWQCVEDSLLSFKLLLTHRPDAHLTIFTREVERAQAICDKLSIRNVHIECLTPTQLQEALRRFSYGFILRQKMSINEVSTPTKFNTYLAAGVIPVLTKATPALSQMLSDCPYKIVVNSADSHSEIANKIISLSENSPNERAVQEAYERIFERYFKDSEYIKEIANAILES